MYSLNTTSLSKLLTKSNNASQDIQIRYVLYKKAYSCFIDRFNEEPKTQNQLMENEAVSFLTCTHTWRLLPRSEELAHGLDRAPKRLPLPSHPFQQVDRRCG